MITCIFPNLSSFHWKTEANLENINASQDSQLA